MSKYHHYSHRRLVSVVLLQQGRIKDLEYMGKHKAYELLANRKLELEQQLDREQEINFLLHKKLNQYKLLVGDIDIVDFHKSNLHRTQ